MLVHFSSQHSSAPILERRDDPGQLGPSHGSMGSHSDTSGPNLDQAGVTNRGGGGDEQGAASHVVAEDNLQLNWRQHFRGVLTWLIMLGWPFILFSVFCNVMLGLKLIRRARLDKKKKKKGASDEVAAAEGLLRRSGAGEEESKTEEGTTQREG